MAVVKALCVYVCMCCIGALDVTEGVGAAFGIPHVPELWEEVSRTHNRSRSRTSSRARSQSRSVIAEVVSSCLLLVPMLMLTLLLSSLLFLSVIVYSGF